MGRPITLALRVALTPAGSLSVGTLAALCEVLERRPGDLLRWEPERPR